MPVRHPTISLPLAGVTLKMVTGCDKVSNPLLNADMWTIGPSEFRMVVDGVATFYARNGNYVEIEPTSGADPKIIRMNLYGDVLVALLHQRNIINFHASSIFYKERGFLLLGETGAGKSSLAASFILHGAGFLSDDLTPLTFCKQQPFIWPVYKTIKLRDDAIHQLKIDRRKTQKAEKGTGKFFFRVKPAVGTTFPLHIILRIQTGDALQTIIREVSSIEGFSLLRSEICSWEMLYGMPETEKAYFNQLVAILRHVRFINVVRPHTYPISKLHSLVVEYLKL